MTQHLLPEHTAQDQATWRRLALVIGLFIASAIALAVGVGIAVG